MASLALMDSTPPDDGTKRTKNKQKPDSPKATKTVGTSNKGKKRNASQKTEESRCPRKQPRRAAACSDFKEKPVRLVDKSSLAETKKKQTVDEEAIAVRLTAGKENGRPCRRLTDFIFHDSEGIQRPFEMSEVDDIFICGLILPLDDSSESEKEPSIRCEGFGRVETWAISGYEDGSPVIWVSTEIADYDCLKPSSSYKKFYDLFYAKACVCIEAYKKLSRSSGGNPDLSLDELLAGVVRAMSGSKCFSGGASIKEFILSQGEFIYNQLVGLDESCKKGDMLFTEMRVLAALRDVSRKHMDSSRAQEASSKGSLTIGSKVSDGDQPQNASGSSVGAGEEDEDVKLAKMLQEEEYWNSMKQKKSRGPVSSSKFYIKINEDEIANDYPLPSYYKTSTEETDEYVVVDNDMDVCDPGDLPLNVLHDWSLYNSDSRLISLELLPMKPCADIDVTIFGSGVMTADDGTGFCLDSDSNHSSSSGSNVADLGGIPIYLSAIKEWKIEFGSEMVFVSIRTDLSWYRLGKPSKQYAPWFEPVLKTAKLAIDIITLLKKQSRVSRLSFEKVIKRVSEFEKDHPHFVSSNQTSVERYVVVHGPIILQQFSEYPDAEIKKCPFVIGLARKMEERHHTKWLVKKKKVLQKNVQNLNPRAALNPYVSKRKPMQATTTRLINRIWGEYYSNYSPEEPQEEISCPVKDDEEAEEQEENEEDDVEDVTPMVSEKTLTPAPASRTAKSSAKSQEIKWVGESLGKTSSGEHLYSKAIIHGDVIAVGTSVSVEAEETHCLSSIYFVEYMFETSDGTKMFHGRKMQRGSFTVLGNAANEREVFLTNECMEFELGDVNEKVTADIRSTPWGYVHRKANAEFDKNDRARAEERKKKGLQIEYYCKSLYCPEKGAFLSLPVKTMGLGSGICHACIETKALSDMEHFKVNPSKTSFVYKGTEYAINDFIYVSPHHFSTDEVENGTFKGGRNVGLKAYVVCQLLEIHVPKAPKQADPTHTEIRVRRFFRPEDISAEKSYCSDIREVYYSEEMHSLFTDTIEGRCEVRKRRDLPSRDVPALFEHIFFCECSYDSSKGSLKQLPSDIRFKYSTGKDDDAISRKKKGKCKGEGDFGIQKQKEESHDNRLTTLDIFAGCGGLSEGLQQSGVTNTKWAIEYEEPAGDAFRLNHPESFVFVNNCNVILRAVMDKCGDVGDCISTPEAADLASSLGEKEKSNLPMPGQVDFINGGPPCQGFSGMNRFNQGTWSKVQCEMILAFLSFADYFRPKFFLLENVRTFVSFNKGQTFRLTIASLLEMGYQVRFGILEAGTFGVPQSRKRAFIWAASPEEILPDWPEPMHVFAVPELKITLSGNLQYAAARSTAAGAPFRAITVRDTIGDLPPVANGASKTNLEYQIDPTSWFQKRIRGNMAVLSDHIAKEMNELNLIRCKKIPKRPGCDWQDLPDEKVKLSTGQMVDLIPWCLPNTAKRHNQWKGLFGRLDWEGNFPTSITDPQPMGKVGMCFHPEQDRIVTVRECARSQGFPDSYQFSGNILHKHRQIGNAVPPPLAYALGRKLKQALEKKKRSQ